MNIHKIQCYFSIIYILNLLLFLYFINFLFLYYFWVILLYAFIVFISFFLIFLFSFSSVLFYQFYYIHLNLHFISVICQGKISNF